MNDYEKLLSKFETELFEISKILKNKKLSDKAAKQNENMELLKLQYRKDELEESINNIKLYLKRLNYKELVIDNENSIRFGEK